MKKILLALTLATLAGACADAPTAPAAAPDAASASTSSAFNVKAVVAYAPANPSDSWIFGVDMQNHSSTNLNDYYFTWTDGPNVVEEGYGKHTYTVPDNRIGPDIDLYVDVTGPDGYDWSQITLDAGPWEADGTRTITCLIC